MATARVTTFTVDDTFPLSQVNVLDRRFMSRLDRKAWEQQVQTLMVEIGQQGLMAPVGIARLVGEHLYVVVYGFTRTEAVTRLGWTTIRANVYEDLNETDARMLNAGDNAWHTQLTDWERALQIQKLRTIGIPVESANGAPSLTSIFGLSKRTILYWMSVVEYPSPPLHQAIAENKIGLQQALIFRKHPMTITEAWVARCIEGDWSSRELELRLSAVDTATDDGSATLHVPLASEPMPASATLHVEAPIVSPTERATLHGADESVHPQLSKAGRWLLQVTQQQVDTWSPEEQQDVHDSLRRIFKVAHVGFQGLM